MSNENLRSRELLEFIRLNPGLTRRNLKSAMGWDHYPDYVFTRWLKGARRLAIREDLLIPMATYDNGYTYELTDDPTKAFQPSMQVQAQALGVKKLQYAHDDFMGGRLAKLPKAAREIVQRRLEFEAAQRAIAEAYIDNERAAIAAMSANDKERLALSRSQA